MSTQVVTIGLPLNSHSLLCTLIHVFWLLCFRIEPCSSGWGNRTLPTMPPAWCGPPASVVGMSRFQKCCSRYQYNSTILNTNSIQCYKTKTKPMYFNIHSEHYIKHLTAVKVVWRCPGRMRVDVNIFINEQAVEIATLHCAYLIIKLITNFLNNLTGVKLIYCILKNKNLFMIEMDRIALKTIPNSAYSNKWVRHSVLSAANCIINFGDFQEIKTEMSANISSLPVRNRSFGIELLKLTTAKLT